MPKYKITRTCEAVYETIVEAIDAETAHGIALELDSAEDYRLVAEHEEHDEPIPLEAGSTSDKFDRMSDSQVRDWLVWVDPEGEPVWLSAPDHDLRKAARELERDFFSSDAPTSPPPTERYIADKIKALETSHDDLLACLRNLVSRELIRDIENDHFDEVRAAIRKAQGVQKQIY